MKTLDRSVRWVLRPRPHCHVAPRPDKLTHTSLIKLIRTRVGLGISKLYQTTPTDRDIPTLSLSLGVRIES